MRNRGLKVLRYHIKVLHSSQKPPGFVFVLFVFLDALATSSHLNYTRI